MTQQAGAPNAEPGRGIDGYVTAGNQQQVNFIGIDNHVHEVFYDNVNQWHHNDLTQKAGAPNAAPRSGLDAYLTAGNEQHVNFIGIDNHVHEVFYDNVNQWHHNAEYSLRILA